MVDFGRQPDATVDFRLVPNSRSPYEACRDYSVIDCGRMPSVAGVYVIRFSKRELARLRGHSSILKIGLAKNFKSRFKAMNGKNDCTVRESLAETIELYTNVRGQSFRTDAHFMCLMGKLRELGPMVADLFYTDENKRLEREFILKYLDEHWELPPLNTSYGNTRKTIARQQENA